MTRKKNDGSEQESRRSELDPLAQDATQPRNDKGKRRIFKALAAKTGSDPQLKRAIRAELNKQLLRPFHSTALLPFEPGDHRKVAVKIVALD